MNPAVPTLEQAESAPVRASVRVSPTLSAIHPSTRGRILQVDDDPIVRAVFHGWLKKHGYAHQHAASLDEAEALLNENPFDVVLSDIHMPGNYRLEWTEQLLARENAPAVILITGTPELETACRAANLPVAGYLLKPAEFATLDATLQGVIRRQRRRTDFLSLSRDILQLLGSHGMQHSTEENMLVDKLALLAGCFSSRTSGTGATGSSNDLLWRAAIADTIAVIEKTKHSFRSKDLGELRHRLQQLLGTL
ncbi:MAG TPA: response regulator [Lacunisphaera sp.]